MKFLSSLDPSKKYLAIFACFAFLAFVCLLKSPTLVFNTVRKTSIYSACPVFSSLESSIDGLVPISGEIKIYLGTIYSANQTSQMSRISVMIKDESIHIIASSNSIKWKEFDREMVTLKGQRNGCSIDTLENTPELLNVPSHYRNLKKRYIVPPIIPFQAQARTLINFFFYIGSDPSEPPVSPAGLSNLYFGNDHPDAASENVQQIYNRNSLGIVNFVGLNGPTVDYHDVWIKIPELTNTNCDAVCDVEQWVKAAIRARPGYDPAQYNHNIYYMDTNPCCDWGGMANPNSNQVWISGYPKTLESPKGFSNDIAHEIGHNLNMGHSASTLCLNVMNRGPKCALKNYGDPFDVMGGDGSVQPNFQLKNRMNAGWLPLTYLPNLINPGRYGGSIQETNTVGVSSLKTVYVLGVEIQHTVFELYKPTGSQIKPNAAPCFVLVRNWDQDRMKVKDDIGGAADIMFVRNKMTVNGFYDGASSGYTFNAQVTAIADDCSTADMIFNIW